MCENNFLLQHTPFPYPLFLKQKIVMNYLFLQGGFNPTLDQQVAIGVITGTAALLAVAALGFSVARCAMRRFR